MSKNARIQNLNRFAQLAKIGEIVFHTDDLANLWRITNKNTLYTTIKRYVGQGLLFRIYKGFYGIRPPQEIDPCLLGVKALHGYAYVSCETVLREEGIIQQELSTMTLVSSETKRFPSQAIITIRENLPINSSTSKMESLRRITA